MTTWNPADIGGDVTLSNGDLTATKTGGIIFRSGRATTSATTGKKYFECVVNAVTTPANLAAVGVAESTASLSTYIGQTNESTGYYSDGTVYKNDILLTTLAAYGVGDTVGMAIDEDAGKGWFCDGTGSYGTGDPATGANPHFTFTAGTAYFPAFTVYHGTNLDSITANFDATGLSHAIPSGFSVWDVFVGEAGSGYFRSAHWGAKYWAAAFWGASDAPPEPPAPDQPTSGGVWRSYRLAADLRRARERELAELAITEAEQRRIDRAAAKIAKGMDKQGLAATVPAVVAQPAFDALLMALQPSEGMIEALAQAIVERIAWSQEVRRADDEAAIMTLLAEL